MKNGRRTLLHIAFVLILSFLFAIPVQASFWKSADLGMEERRPVETVPGKDNGLIELTEEQIDDLGLGIMSPPPRSEPWNEWQRYSYHRGGEDGLVAYQQSENRVFIYGGGRASWSNQQNYWSYTGYDDLFIYDFDDNKWYALERSTSPGGRVGFSYVVDEAKERFIIYGGMSGSMLDDLWIFDMNTLQWSKTLFPGFPTQIGRRGYAPMVLDTAGGAEDLYILFGMKDDQYNYYVDNMTGFYKIDLKNPGTAPVSLNDGRSSGMLPRYHHSMCIDEEGRKIYMFGGMHMPNETYEYLHDFWVYDMISNTWTQLTTHPDMPLNYGARIFFRPTDDKIYLWGGRETSGGTAENETLWIYDTDLGSWDRHDYYDIGTDVPNGRLLYHFHYSALSDRFFVFGGRYYSGSRSYRYRDLSYLNLQTRTWTLFPLTYNANDNTNGIFAYESSLNMLHYIGPGTSSNGTAYTYYYDLSEKEWSPAIYNTNDANPHSRSSAGMAYDEQNNTVYIYGGQYTTGWGSNRRYHNLGDMWKVDLSTNAWEKIWDTAGGGMRHGFDMVWDSNRGRAYFFGGRYYLTETSSASNAYGDFQAYIPGPTGGIFEEITPSGGPVPGARYGAGAIYIPELDKFYLCAGRDPNPDNTIDYRDLWEFDFSTMRWTQLKSLSSPMVFPKLDYDPLTKELYLTGGDDYVIKRYRILENAWYTMDPDINPGSMSGQAHIFLPETRDLWVYGGGIKPGIWKIGMPYRLAIQSIYFKDPEDGGKNAYSMLRPYTFGTVIKTVSGPDDLDRVTMSFIHRKGAYKIVYNASSNSFHEQESGDYAEITDTSAVWDGKLLTLEASVLFHWNFSSRPNLVDRRISVDARGTTVASDFLEVKSFFTVKNRIDLIGDLSVVGDIQGELSGNDWVQAGEMLNFSGPMVRYSNSDLFPPPDTYTLLLSEGLYTENNDGLLLTDIYRTWDVEKTAGEPMDFRFDAPNRTLSRVYYVLNVTGVYKDDLEQAKFMNLSVDGTPPSKPATVTLHADSFDDTHTVFDNELEVYLTWMGAGVSESGIKTFYWSFEDMGGTTQGTPVDGGEAIIELPSNGTHTVYVWAEDSVGNIGPSANASITIDTELPEFRIISPDLDQVIPYQVLDVRVNVTDTGGSKLNSQKLQMRFTNDGLDSVNMWTGADAWKDLSYLWTEFPKDSMEFVLGLGRTTEGFSIPKLSDTEENFLQLRITDNAGNTRETRIYNIRVNTDLRFPKVTLLGPDEGEVFTDPEDIHLNWTLDFFLPEDVVYHLFIYKERIRVETHDESEMIETTNTFYDPLFITHGTWYWTVIPVARGQWYGNATNGIKSFVMKDEKSYAFEVTTPKDSMLRARGTTGIPIDFTIENTGTNPAVIDMSADIKGIGNLTWPAGTRIEVGVGETKGTSALLDILSSTPIGNYTLIFYFNSTSDVNREVRINVKVIENIIDNTPTEEKKSNSIYFILGAVLIILLLVIIAAVYFLVLKKGKGSELPRFDDMEDLDRLEEELVTGGGTGVTMAPQPKGLGTGVSTGSVTSPTEPPEGEIGEGEPEELEEEETKLVEEGSEDDWMNLVAEETKSLEEQPDIVQDKVKREEGKSLQDLLAEMSSEVDEEDL
ncbi:MAG: hypothetical protein DRN57_07530 [Thermoplasmata archaeon]|nr:MAG: hypothetical protein DRN57_07530 [Thermoplasmata archaeon]